MLVLLYDELSVELIAIHSGRTSLFLSDAKINSAYPVNYYICLKRTMLATIHTMIATGSIRHGLYDPYHATSHMPEPYIQIAETAI
jgi:hypothetical protein